MNSKRREHLNDLVSVIGHLCRHGRDSEIGREIESYIRKWYVEKPTDCNSTPFWVGDSLKGKDGRRIVEIIGIGYNCLSDQGVIELYSNDEDEEQPFSDVPEYWQVCTDEVHAEVMRSMIETLTNNEPMSKVSATMIAANWVDAIVAGLEQRI